MSQGFGDSAFGESEFGDARAGSGFGETGFGEGGFGGSPPGAIWVGLFGSSPFGAEPFGGALIEDPDEPEEPAEPIPELAQTVRPRGPQTVRERFSHNIKSPFNESEGTTWDRLLNTIAEEFEEWHDVRDDVMMAQYVDSAVGQQLDKIGSFVQLPRRHEESDDHYRGRLKVQLRTLISGGTIPDVKETAAVLLQTHSENIEITENFDNEAARFDISINENLLEDSEVDVSDFVSFLDEIRAAGVRIVGELEGSFEHRSEQDFLDDVNDPSKGYGEGVYASLLIN